MKYAVTLLVFCVAALMALGLTMLYSSTMGQPGAHYLLKQLLWCPFALALCLGAASVDYRLLKKFAFPLLIISVVLLVLVLVPKVGLRINRASRWLGYGSFRVQPSELAKLSLIIVLAWYGEHYQRQMRTWKKGVLIPAALIAVVLGLIFIEPDRGTTILMACVAGMILVTAGVRWVYIVPPILAAMAALAFSLYHDPMRSKRIAAWLDVEQHKDGIGYQAYHAMLALGAGGWTGLGLGNGLQKLGFVPENHTDFILSIIGEELGLVATLLVVVAFVSILFCGLFISWNARDTFGLLLGCGISFLIGLQAFINIGVATSALPNKGLPLPFVSYGGSNLLIMLTAVGLLLSIARQSRSPQEMADQSSKTKTASTQTA
jgi:cell division protein FtsW